MFQVLTATLHRGVIVIGVLDTLDEAEECAKQYDRMIVRIRRMNDG